MIKVIVQCDKCNNQLTTKATNFANAENRALKEGWSIVTTIDSVEHLCPQHSPFKKKENV